jgi:hypothetical protein
MLLSFSSLIALRVFTLIRFQRRAADAITPAIIAAMLMMPPLRQFAAERWLSYAMLRLCFSSAAFEAADDAEAPRRRHIMLLLLLIRHIFRHIAAMLCCHSVADISRHCCCHHYAADAPCHMPPCCFAITPVFDFFLRCLRYAFQLSPLALSYASRHFMRLRC